MVEPVNDWRTQVLRLRRALSTGGDKLLMWLAWHLPARLVMWCAVRVGAHATTGKYGDTVVPEMPFMQALKRWDK